MTRGRHRLFWGHIVDDTGMVFISLKIIFRQETVCETGPNGNYFLKKSWKSELFHPESILYIV